MNEEDKEQMEKDIRADIMSELLTSERFVTFFNCNYDLHKEVDEDNKEITFRLIEVPPEKVQERYMEVLQQKSQDEKNEQPQVQLSNLSEMKEYTGEDD